MTTQRFLTFTTCSFKRIADVGLEVKGLEFEVSLETPELSHRIDGPETLSSN